MIATQTQRRLTLLVADNTTGYFGVNHHSGRSRSKPYEAQVRRGGKIVSLGYFATAEEAALCVARSPEGRSAAAAAGAPPLVSEEEGKSAVPTRATLKEEGAVPPMPLGAYVKGEEVAPPMPPGAFVKEENVPPMPPDAVVKQEHEVVVEERSQGGRAKRQRNE